jgi:hypothetical protein
LASSFKRRKTIKNIILGIFSLVAGAQTATKGDAIKSAMTAGPPSISAESTVKDWSMNTIREGSNGWTFLPDRPDTPGVNPWCVNEPWLNFLNAYVNKTEPSYTEVGFAYMLAGDTPGSNSDPYATTATGHEDWVTNLYAHLMLVVPDRGLSNNMSTDDRNGNPWVMWPDTPYAQWFPSTTATTKSRSSTKALGPKGPAPTHTSSSRFFSLRC